MAEAFLGFGGNVGDVRATFDRAIANFCDGKAVRLTGRSSDYRTPPWGITGQPDFFNLCISVDTMLSPRALLERALAVESAFGRDRASETPWGPRTLDIDVLSYDDGVADEPWLTLPHPRLFDRAFVLVPLVELRPDLSIRGVRVADALAQVDAGGIERLPPRG